MTQLLISVTSVNEAQIALQCGADIIDLKDPVQGALGALPLETVAEIVTFYDVKDKPENFMISATVGDFPMQAELLAERVLALSETEVDIIKIGFFKESGAGSSDYESCLEAMSAIAQSGIRLVAVLFIEYNYSASLISAIKKAGFYGVMLDTAFKNGATFLDYFSVAEIKKIAENAHAQDLLFGLAGSLNLQHVAIAKEIAPDYIGFRGGVCINNQRKLELAPEKIRALREVM